MTPRRLLNKRLLEPAPDKLLAASKLVLVARGILYKAVLTPDLNSNIIRSLPMELRITFNDKYTMFINLDPDNNCSPAVFKFLNQYAENLNNSYKANPMLFDVGLSPMNIGVKPVR